MIKNISLFYNKEKETAGRIAGIIKDITSSENINLSDGSIRESTELVISVGGDGTLLRTARLTVKYGVPVAHINVGTLGFLGFELDDAAGYIRTLIKGKFKIQERIMLTATVGSQKFNALNDIVIKNGDTARIIDLELFLEDKKVYSIKGDGVIISTPTGSTAYSLAAGGPIVTPDLLLMVITPLNPHTLSTRPVIVEDISVKVKCPVSDEEIILTSDGQVHSKFNPPVEISINIAKDRLKLVEGDENFFDLLSRKMNWG